MPSIDLEQLRAYVKNGLQLIPLHKWNAKSRMKNGVLREDGKRPLDSNWTKKPYDNGDMLKLAAKGVNLGCRLPANIVVVDVDPRNYPKDEKTGKTHNSFEAFCKATKFDPTNYPCVHTGGGGFHFYTRKNPDIAVMDSLEGYEGIEFKTLGRQVVAAGSLHPSGNMYRWAWTFDADPFAKGLDEINDLPQAVINIIARPKFTTRTAGSGGGGEYEPEQIAAMLASLDPEDFRDHEKWFELMRACHHASAGEARQEFIDWSTLDPNYQDFAVDIGRRWDSLHLNRPGQVTTYRTLHKVLRDHGQEKAIPKKSAAEDFDDDLPASSVSPSIMKDLEPEFFVPEHERKGPLQLMNDKCTFVFDGNKSRIAMLHKYEEQDDSKREMYLFPTTKDFHEFYANKMIEDTNAKGQSVAVPLSHKWLQWPHRATKYRVVFEPEYEPKDALNLWRGWGIEPRPGDWSLMQELMLEVLCDGDKTAYEFLLNWIAYMFQHPGRPAEVAICFYGDKGTGKSTLGRFLRDMTNPYSMAATNSEHLLGRFTSHLVRCIFLFSDEAIMQSDKKAIALLQGLITENQLPFEKKGAEIDGVKKNMLHLMLASDQEKFIPASLVNGERRYFVMHVNNKRQGDKAFFDALHEQMERRGGLQAMFHDMMVRDLGKWAPRGNIPKTAGLLDQQLKNMTPEEEFWFKGLDEGGFDGVSFVPGYKGKIPLWINGRVRMFVEDFRDSFALYCKTKGLREAAHNRALDRFFFSPFKKMCPGFNPQKKSPVGDRAGELRTFPSTPTQAQSIEIPSLRVCREAFEAQIGQQIDWSYEIEKHKDDEEETIESGENDEEEITEIGENDEEEDPFRLEE